MVIDLCTLLNGACVVIVLDVSFLHVFLILHTHYLPCTLYLYITIHPILSFRSSQSFCSFNSTNTEWVMVLSRYQYMYSRRIYRNFIVCCICNDKKTFEKVLRVNVCVYSSHWLYYKHN